MGAVPCDGGRFPVTGEGEAVPCDGWWLPVMGGGCVIPPAVFANSASGSEAPSLQLSGSGLCHEALQSAAGSHPDHPPQPRTSLPEHLILGSLHTESRMQLGIWHLVGTETRLIHPRMCGTKGGLDVSRGLGVVMVHRWRLTDCNTRPIWWGAC